MALFSRTWGAGRPLVALHPIGLESSAYSALGTCLQPHGFQTIALDLPGFGRSVSDGKALSPANMAQAVIAELPDEPVRLLGISMGARVALEIALVASDRVTSVVAVAPYLPWLRNRWFLQGGRVIRPRLMSRMLPLDRAWPVLKALTDFGLRSKRMSEDAVARAGTRMVYNLSCEATRWALLSAARGLCVDPAYGPNGLWSRLQRLSVPTTFVLGGRDRLVPAAYGPALLRSAPNARQIVVECLRHSINAEHARCLESVLTELYATDQDSNPPATCSSAQCRSNDGGPAPGPW